MHANKNRIFPNINCHMPLHRCWIAGSHTDEPLRTHTLTPGIRTEQKKQPPFRHYKGSHMTVCACLGTYAGRIHWITYETSKKEEKNVMFFEKPYYGFFFPFALMFDVKPHLCRLAYGNTYIAVPTHILHPQYYWLRTEPVIRSPLKNETMKTHMPNDNSSRRFGVTVLLRIEFCSYLFAAETNIIKAMFAVQSIWNSQETWSSGWRRRRKKMCN